MGYPICQEQNRLYLRIPYPNDELELLPQPAETTHRRSEPRSHTYTRKKGDSRLPMVNGRQPKYTVVKNGGGGGGLYHNPGESKPNFRVISSSDCWMKNEELRKTPSPLPPYQWASRVMTKRFINQTFYPRLIWPLHRVGCEFSVVHSSREKSILA